MFTGIIVTAIICISVMAISITPMVHEFLLKKEKIKADALVKAEEIKAKNQLEIEKILLLNKQQSTEKITRFDEEDIYGSNRSNKERA